MAGILDLIDLGDKNRGMKGWAEEHVEAYLCGETPSGLIIRPMAKGHGSFICESFSRLIRDRICKSQG